MIKFIKYIRNNNLGEYYTNKMFKNVTTLKIGGLIKLLYYPNSIESFIIFYRFYLKNNNYPLVVIGNGSNVLANSKEYNGIVVSFKKILCKYYISENLIITTSGVMMMDIINYCKKKNKGGLEKFSYIPGTVGGMVKMNAGAYNDEICNHLIYVTVIKNNGEVKIYNKKELKFSYRCCELDDGDIILNCCFELIEKNKQEIIEKIKSIQVNRELKQPINEFNAGSTFKNNGEISAWKFIDSVGLRGYRINDAMVSNKHCNFLININNCNSDDMILLINEIIYKVKNEFDIDLELEWKLINF